VHTPAGLKLDGGTYPFHRKGRAGPVTYGDGLLRG
jgi:hypothetical protein